MIKNRPPHRGLFFNAQNVILSAHYLVIPTVVEESCDFCRIQTLFTSFLQLPFGQRFLGKLRNDKEKNV
jgi:hypothetical protein